MPEDKFGFKSTPAQRSFGEHVLHIAQVDLMLLGTLGAKAAPPTLNMKATTKADIPAQLKASMDYGSAVGRVRHRRPRHRAREVAAIPRRHPSRLNVIYFSLGQPGHLRSDGGALRLNGITPPASVRGGV